MGLGALNFNSFSALDNGVDEIKFSINGAVFASVKYADAGLLPESVTNYCEKYYRTASICNSEGTALSSTSDALISYTKSLAMGSRYRSIAIDNMTLTQIKVDPLAFTAATVDLSDAPALKYYVSATELNKEGYTAPYVVSTFNGTETKITEYETVGEEYVFTYYGVTPESLNNTVSTTFYATKDGAVVKGATTKGTMANFCYSILSTYAEDSSKADLRRLAVDYLEYGGRLQQYIGYKVNDLADKNLTDAQKAWGTSSVEKAQNDLIMLSRYAQASVNWTGVALALKNTPQIKFVFRAESISGLTFKVSNFTNEWTYGESDIVALDDGSYAVYFDGGLNSNLRKPVYITAYNSEGKAVSSTFGYSVESYVSRISEDSSLGKVLSAMMEYGEATQSYEGEVSVPQHTVTFVNYNGAVLKTETVPTGGSATPPANPSRTGYVFNGWDGVYTNVSSDVTVTATYIMTDESLVALMMREGKIICDFIRDMDFNYGHAQINPAINWRTLDSSTAIDPSEKIVSCDRLVDWILYRSGFVDQPYKNGLVTVQLDDWLAKIGFTKITSVSQLKAGDVVFSSPDSAGEPIHTFMCAGTNLRYDAGSDARIDCVTGRETNGSQPVSEIVPTTGSGRFLYAYRPHAKCLATQPSVSLFEAPGSNEAVPSNSATTVVSGDAAFDTAYTPGKDYKQYELKLSLSASPSTADTNYWNSGYVGVRVPENNQVPTSAGGVWLAFNNTTTARLYFGTGASAWNVSLASVTIPESFASAHTLHIIDNGDLIRYYMYKADGTRVLICSIRLDTVNDKVVVYNSAGGLIFQGTAVVNDGGYFENWSHLANTNITNVTLSGAN